MPGEWKWPRTISGTTDALYAARDELTDPVLSGGSQASLQGSTSPTFQLRQKNAPRRNPAYDSSLPKAAKPEGRAAKPADRAAKQAAKLDEKEARERRKAIGDAIKEGMRLPAEPGTLTFRGVRPAVMDLIFQGALPSAAASASVQLTQPQLVAVFGTTKIEKGGSRDARYVCERATARYDSATMVLHLDYFPKHTGSGVWWRN
ncbi:hypothetical protein EMIHUDRAFT_454745 [Emiliania huxleyi CCMP1516]|uniref:Uncharacterized protein n=2 Tax=Emiliania huxleyi TaxID=2903 RepID=A0A0D3KQ91_EMIH1|nr:hypothetical protein EMIHUDRAFT_454745 [Emiliania huxleyi CCMP1516]EOD37926.1 hypothetical protein EMIHUDRAFT_454745 [Emiliania huxleyi CCMP1516]|eukprot:XP_005790355.1 hypothetical protein EMIHUDRAFT_454745 [Emiliania huxleyi CCMP1516]